MSSINVKADIGSKVLPGDKTGLPFEIWRIILSYLNEVELCAASCVCKTWNELVLCLDSTRWKELFLMKSDWKHPFWPLSSDLEPPSWKKAFKDQFISDRFWAEFDKEPDSSNCLFVLKRPKLRKTIHVGPGQEYEMLKNALAVANAYDRIIVHPGIYDEQFEMASKIPFELVGEGELGSVILVVCIEQIAPTGRISNIVFRAPWFTNFILKVRSGYMQMDNCILEDGLVYVQNPGSVHIKFCTFRHATVLLQHVKASVIENCEFSQTDSAAVTIEGHPRDEKNWSFGYLMEKVSNACTIKQLQRHPKGATVPLSGFSMSTGYTFMHSKSGKADTMSINDTTIGARSICSSAKYSLRRLSLTDRRHSLDPSHMHWEGDHQEVRTLHHHKSSSFGHTHGHRTHPVHGSHGENHNDPRHHWQHPHVFLAHIHKHDMGCKFERSGSLTGTDYSGSYGDSEAIDAENFCFDSTHAPKLWNKHKTPGDMCGTNKVKGHEHALHHGKFEEDHREESGFDVSCENPSCPSCSLSHTGEDHPPGNHSNNLAEHPRSPAEGNGSGESVGQELGAAGRVDDPDHGVPAQEMEPDPDLRIQLRSPRSSRSHSPISVLSGSSLMDGDEDSIGQFDSGSDHSRHRGLHSSDSSSDDDDYLSDSGTNYSSSEESVIMLTYPEHKQPRSISQTSLNEDVASIDSQNQSEFIRVVQDEATLNLLKEVRGCLIQCCRMSQSKGGVMVALQGHAIIHRCDINSVSYGVRCIQNAKVILLKNEIHHCRTSGVFMRLAASGLIAGNDIHSNGEAGIDIRKNADPIVQSNKIHHGKRSGVVVLGSGRGKISNNEIYHNREAGVYILYRGNPVVCKNQIYGGRAAGVAVNEEGRGYITDNVISGNQWGGVDIRHGGDPVITQNIISNGLSDGIVIGEKGRGSVENNIISGNAGCGVWITAACQPMLHGNQINNNRDSGVTFVNKMHCHDDDVMVMPRDSELTSQRSAEYWQYASCEEQQPHPRRPCTMATLEYNNVFHNNGKGVRIQFSDEILLKNNAFHGNRGDGVFVDHDSTVSITDNSITCNNGNGILAFSKTKVKVSGNGIFDNRDHGIYMQDNAEIFQNDVIGNRRSAIYVKNCSSVEVRENRILSGTEKAVHLVSVTGGCIENNQLLKHANSCVDIVGDSRVRSSSNTVIQIDNKQQENTSELKNSWMLKNPPARPHIEAPSSIPSLPSNQVTSITRVMVPSAPSCEDGSKFCVIV